jgi:tetratricopeptide (TPR) repeat protein
MAASNPGISAARRATVQVRDGNRNARGHGLLLDLGGEVGIVVLTCDHILEAPSADAEYFIVPDPIKDPESRFPVRYDPDLSSPNSDAAVLRVSGVSRAEPPLLYRVDPSEQGKERLVTCLTWRETDNFNALLAEPTSLQVQPDGRTCYKLSTAYRLRQPGQAEPGISGAVVIHEGGIVGLVAYARPETPGAERECYMLPLAVWAERLRALEPFLTPIIEAADPKAPLTAKPLPGRPLCIGRKREVAALVSTLVSPKSPPTPILGPPGIGKTTVTLVALHDERVKNRYGDRRYFVECDGVTRSDGLATAIAETLGLHIAGNIRHALHRELGRAPALLVLDNAETPWEGDVLGTEGLLCFLAGIAGLRVIVSMRGNVRPRGSEWRDPVILSPLTCPAAQELFLKVAGKHFRADRHLDPLLQPLEGVPLAVTLLAHQAEGQKNLAALWRQWERENTRMLKYAGGDHRLTNLERSFEVSIRSPRMTPESLRLLRLLALLPGGGANQDLERIVPGLMIQGAAALTKIALAVEEGPRLRLLAPIREYVQRRRPPEPDDRAAFVDYYTRLAIKHGREFGTPGGRAAAARLSAEAPNFEAVLSLALQEPAPTDAIQAVAALGWFIQLSGRCSVRLVQRAAKAARKSSHWREAAECIYWLGEISVAHAKYRAARAYYNKAIELYRADGNEHGEARCRKSLGLIAVEAGYRRPELYDTARADLNEALRLYQSVHDASGQAGCLSYLGDICFEGAKAHIRRRQIPAAETELDLAKEHYAKAMRLYQHVIGQADCLRRLAKVAFMRGDFDETEAHAKHAIETYRNEGFVLGEANATQFIGDVSLWRDGDKAAARATWTVALELFERSNEPYSIASMHERFGLIADSEEDRTAHQAEARRIWLRLGRADLAGTVEAGSGIWWAV